MGKLSRTMVSKYIVRHIGRIGIGSVVIAKSKQSFIIRPRFRHALIMALANQEDVSDQKHYIYM
jgi:hypothetical protein